MVYLVKVVVGKLLAGVPALDARAVDEDPDLVPVGQDLWRQGADLLLRGHVGDVDPGLAAELLDLLLGGLVAGVSLYGASAQSKKHW